MLRDVCVNELECPVPERPTVKGGGQSHYGVDNREEAEEENEEQQAHVEVVGLGGLEDSLVGHVTAHHCPTLVVHGAQQTQDVDAHQSRGIKCTHPDKI